MCHFREGVRNPGIYPRSFKFSPGDPQAYHGGVTPQWVGGAEAHRGRPGGGQTAPVSQGKPHSQTKGALKTAAGRPAGGQEAPRSRPESTLRAPGERPGGALGALGVPERSFIDSGWLLGSVDVFTWIFARANFESNDSTAEWRRHHGRSAMPAHKRQWPKVTTTKRSDPEPHRVT